MTGRNFLALQNRTRPARDAEGISSIIIGDYESWSGYLGTAPIKSSGLGRCCSLSWAALQGHDSRPPSREQASPLNAPPANNQNGHVRSLILTTSTGFCTL